MTAARDEMLRRVREALHDRPAGGRSAVPVARDYLGAGMLVVADPVALFAERVEDYRAEVTTCTTADLAVAVADRLRAHGVGSVVVDAGLPRDMLAAFDGSVLADDGSLTVAQLDAVDGVVTTCTCAVALTGTIVLDHGPGQGRRALTLIPDLHLVVVRAEQIVANVPEAIDRCQPAQLPTASAAEPERGVQTWISGPSATSDIELNRVEGVHGPRTLEVVVVRQPDSAASNASDAQTILPGG